MKRLVIGFCIFVNRLVSAIIRTGNLVALALAAFIYVQIQADICTMRTDVRESLDTVACTAKLQDYVSHAQSFASNCADIASLEAHRAFTLDTELTLCMEDYDSLEHEHNKQITINRSMRVYIERLHKILRDNNLKIPAIQPRPIGG